MHFCQSNATAEPNFRGDFARALDQTAATSFSRTRARPWPCPRPRYAEGYEMVEMVQSILKSTGKLYTDNKYVDHLQSHSPSLTRARTWLIICCGKPIKSCVIPQIVQMTWNCHASCLLPQQRKKKCPMCSSAT